MTKERMCDLATYESNQRSSETKHYNRCKHYFLKDNKEEIENMFASLVMGTPSIEILSGPCKGLVIKTSTDVHKWIETHVEAMVDPWKN